MDRAIVFHERRLLVGWRLSDWSEVWYEPVGSADGEEHVYDSNGGAEIGLYQLSTGDPGYREPLFGQVVWFPPFDWKTFQTEKRSEKEALQQQFMADAYKYLSADSRRAEKTMEKDFHRLHDTRWYKFFEALKLYKRRNRQARPSGGTRGAAAAEQEQEEALSEDSGFESNIMQSTRSPADTEMPPPPPPPTARRNAAAGNPRTGSSSNILGKRKRETQSKRSKFPKANSRAQSHQEDQAAQSSEAGDSVGDHTRHNSVPLMSGGLGGRSRTVSPLFMGDPNSGLQNRRSNNSASSPTEGTEYEDDYVFSHPPRENLRDGIVSQNHNSTRFSSLVESGQEREASHLANQDLPPFSTWGDGEGTTASGTGLRASSHPRSEPATTGHVSANHFANKRAATEVDPEDYNMGLSDDEAFERAMSESAALESRTNPATGHGNGMSDNIGHIPDGILRSIEAGNKEDKLWNDD
ncbi:hypothetical protein D0869_11217 [Hortaea werneckii]|uniref:Uncharacterized protein n=1 Tax=Hortaea werneckii TaxID=91943 RepID=A0A3M7A4Q2_HORWE|nr:hypothetical protein KC334_g1092 [Hortaea werneckii]KAI7021131.1 hypothetical protein KC355_g2495 [Hortaea werneckii]KAI7184318.1 hypothetical protein KC324_g7730 [Hortaea werneckii]KAI7582187.1 hypothetical protein KC316_g8014 [Hortaea werneckii]KAI7675331.1 hypothetical protein KC318_g1025 [Hortaea werneckii]